MAEVYRRAAGYKMEKLIAITEPVQAELEKRAREIGARAEALLGEHRHSGDSYIEVSSGHVDRWVTLNDERGQSAAMSIEYGREPHWQDDVLIPGMEGLYILHRAAHLMP